MQDIMGNMNAPASTPTEDREEHISLRKAGISSRSGLVTSSTVEEKAEREFETFAKPEMDASSNERVCGELKERGNDGGQNVDLREAAQRSTYVDKSLDRSDSQSVSGTSGISGSFSASSDHPVKPMNVASRSGSTEFSNNPSSAAGGNVTVEDNPMTKMSRMGPKKKYLSAYREDVSTPPEVTAVKSLEQINFVDINRKDVGIASIPCAAATSGEFLNLHILRNSSLSFRYFV